MDKENIIVNKSYQFGLRIVKLYMFLRKNKVERELLIQLLKPPPIQRPGPKAINTDLALV